MSIEKINKALAELADRENDYGLALRHFANAEHSYRIKKNHEYLKADGTEKTRTATAEIACSDEMRVKLQAEAEKDFLKTKVDDARTAISARKEMLIIEARMTNQV